MTDQVAADRKVAREVIGADIIDEEFDKAPDVLGNVYRPTGEADGPRHPFLPWPPARFSPVLERAESRGGRSPIAEGDAERPLLGSWKHDTGQEAGGPDSFSRLSTHLAQLGFQTSPSVNRGRVASRWSRSAARPGCGLSLRQRRECG